MSNREIKFRAWDLDNKNMRTLDDWTFEFISNDGGKTSDLQMMREEDSMIAPLPNGIVLMQFTGREDVEGKEIYEGDVVKVADNHEYEVVWLEELEYGELCSGWGLKPTKEEGAPFLFDGFAIKHSKVIGNIYENPELLRH